MKRLPKLGEKVKVPFGTSWITATMVEDRGFIGHERIHIITVSCVLFGDEETTIETELEGVRKRVRKKTS